MRVHVTNLYGQGFWSTALKAQNRTMEIARKLGYKELGIYYYDVNSDSSQALFSRLDGIMSSIGNGDVVIFQYPTWNNISFDEAFMKRLNHYIGLKKVIFVHDMSSLMFESDRYLLERQIAFLNQAELVILSSQKMADFLYSKGLKVKKVAIQRMWDFPVSIDLTIIPKFEKIINFAGNPDSWKFDFVKSWDYDTVELKVTADKGEWANERNVRLLGWFNDDACLVNVLRKSGGFGLVWTNNAYFYEYMKINCNYKISAYLAAGIPVIVNNTIAERETIVRNNIGLAVDSLDEAVRRVENMNEMQYNEMVANVSAFSNLIRDGYFTKKILIDAVFKVLYE